MACAADTKCGRCRRGFWSALRAVARRTSGRGALKSPERLLEIEYLQVLVPEHGAELAALDGAL